MVNSCSAFGCTNRFKKDVDIGFFRFPRDSRLKQLWIIAVKRKDWVPSKTSTICGVHFQTGRPSTDENHPDYVPNVFSFNLYNKKNAKLYEKRKRNVFYRTNKESKKQTEMTALSQDSEDQETSLFGEIAPQVPEDTDRRVTETSQLAVNADMHILREENRNAHSKVTKESSKKSALSEYDDQLMNVKLELYEAFTDISDLRKENEMLAEKLSTTEATQNTLQKAVSEKENELMIIKLKLQQAYTEVNALRTEKEELLEKLRAEDIVQNIFQHPNKLHFYTGLNSMKDFDYILSLISNVDGRFKSVSLKTQLLIVLIKLKLNLYMKDLGYIFRISISTVCRICDFLIPFLEVKIYALVKCPINAALKKDIHVSFKNTVHENLYPRLVKYSKSKTKQPEDDEDGTDFEKLDEECI